jgi:hypothetical protein
MHLDLKPRPGRIIDICPVVYCPLNIVDGMVMVMRVTVIPTEYRKAL